MDISYSPRFRVDAQQNSLDDVHDFDSGLTHVSAVKLIGLLVEAAPPWVPEANSADLGQTCVPRFEVITTTSTNMRI